MHSLVADKPRARAMTGRLIEAVLGGDHGEIRGAVVEFIRATGREATPIQVEKTIQALLARDPASFLEGNSRGPGPKSDTTGGSAKPSGGRGMRGTMPATPADQGSVDSTVDGDEDGMVNFDEFFDLATRSARFFEQGG